VRARYVCIISFVNMNGNVSHRPAAAAALFDRCCGDDDNVGRYYDFFLKGQTGRGMPVFIGRRHQCAHGIGNVLGSLLRRVVGFLGSHGLDFLKQNRQTAVLNLIKTSFDIAKDVTSGKKVKEALKTRIPEGIKHCTRATISVER